MLYIVMGKSAAHSPGQGVLIALQSPNPLRKALSCLPSVAGPKALRLARHCTSARLAVVVVCTGGAAHLSM